jgi:hypothetical protein
MVLSTPSHLLSVLGASPPHATYLFKHALVLHGCGAGAVDRDVRKARLRERLAAQSASTFRIRLETGRRSAAASASIARRSSGSTRMTI